MFGALLHRPGGALSEFSSLRCRSAPSSLSGHPYFPCRARHDEQPSAMTISPSPRTPTSAAIARDRRRYSRQQRRRRPPPPTAPGDTTPSSTARRPRAQRAASRRPSRVASSRRPVPPHRANATPRHLHARARAAVSEYATPASPLPHGRLHVAVDASISVRREGRLRRRRPMTTAGRRQVRRRRLLRAAAVESFRSSMTPRVSSSRTAGTAGRSKRAQRFEPRRRQPGTRLRPCARFD